MRTVIGFAAISKRIRGKAERGRVMTDKQREILEGIEKISETLASVPQIIAEAQKRGEERAKAMFGGKGFEAETARAANPEGFTPELMALCRDTCAEFGEPPCWQLPELSQPCELITPCEDCLAGKVLEP